MGHWRAYIIQRLLRLERPLLLCGMLSKFSVLHCQCMYQCQQVQLIWPYLFQRCESSSLGPDGCAHRWHLHVDSKLWLAYVLCHMIHITLKNVIWTLSHCHILHINISGIYLRNLTIADRNFFCNNWWLQSGYLCRGIFLLSRGILLLVYPNHQVVL